jgi:hypothetical protein
LEPFPSLDSNQGRLRAAFFSVLNNQGPTPVNAFPSGLDMLGNVESVVNLRSQVAHGNFDLAMPREQLDGARVLGLTVDQSRLGPTRRVRPGLLRISAHELNPSLDDARVLTGGQVGVREFQ